MNFLTILAIFTLLAVAGLGICVLGVLYPRTEVRGKDKFPEQPLVAPLCPACQQEMRPNLKYGWLCAPCGIAVSLEDA